MRRRREWGIQLPMYTGAGLFAKYSRPIILRMATQPDNAESTTEAARVQGIPEIHAHEGHRRYKLIDLENEEIERTALELVEGSKLLSNRDLWVANFRATSAKFATGAALTERNSDGAGRHPVEQSCVL